MDFKMLFLYKDDNLQILNQSDVIKLINDANSIDEINYISDQITNFFEKFNISMSGIITIVNDKKEELYSSMDRNKTNSLSQGGKSLVPTPPSGVGVRRVTHSSNPINTDNQGFIKVKVLLSCSIIMTLFLYFMLLIANLK